MASRLRWGILLAVGLWFWGCAPPQEGLISLPVLFSDNAVLQREMPIPVWGNANPNSKVTVKFNGQKKSVRADDTGKWMLRLQPEKAGGPFKMTITNGNKSLTINNLLVGEVWLCSGQSNMEWEVKQSQNAEQEIAGADFPQIRHLQVPRGQSETPIEDFKSEWVVCSPKTVGNFTAVGYFFAREIFTETKVPVGLIHSSWGGTNAETWVSAQKLAQLEDYKHIRPLQPGDFEQIRQEKYAPFMEKLKTLGIGEKDIADNLDAWTKPGFDAAAWPRMSIPGNWERLLPDMNGVVYFRKEFDLPERIVKKGIRLYVGKVDDVDDTFVNGVKVGHTEVWDTKREYDVPASHLKTGKNVVVVRAYDNYGGGGIWGEKDEVKVTSEGGYTLPLAGDWQFMIGKIEGVFDIHPNDYPCQLFNTMIAPLIPYGIRGTLWYQGESNTGQSLQYRTIFPALIEDWRNHWGQGDFPFLFVQLANYEASRGDSQKGSAWAELREAQTMTLSLPNTGMAVTIDIGEEKDIHPRNKQDVGKRLAAQALSLCYGKTGVSAGPLFEKMEIQGNRVWISFKNADGGLFAKNDETGALNGFEVAAADQIFHPANAAIEGGKVAVSSEKVIAPVAVRYGWADFPPQPLNLYNMEGFPASPFRTDDWRSMTGGNKYEPALKISQK
jgi:sialate O-acetylesterase